MADYHKDDSAWNYSCGMYAAECRCCGGEFNPRKQEITDCTLCGAAKEVSCAPRFGNNRSFHRDHQYKGCGHVPRLSVVQGMLEVTGRSQARDTYDVVHGAVTRVYQVCERIESELNAATELHAQLLKERTSLLRGRKKEQAEQLLPSIEYVEGIMADSTKLLAVATKLKSAVKVALAEGEDLSKFLGQ